MSHITEEYLAKRVFKMKKIYLFNINNKNLCINRNLTMCVASSPMRSNPRAGSMMSACDIR